MSGDERFLSTRRRPRSARFELAKQASAILKRARCDAMTGAKKDGRYRRNKSAQNKRLGHHWRAKRKALGKLGAASPVKIVPPEGAETSGAEGG
jgi:hypothetical protein